MILNRSIALDEFWASAGSQDFGLEISSEVFDFSVQVLLVNDPFCDLDFAV